MTLRVTDCGPAPDAPGPRVGAGRVVYAVGDIHGRCDLLEELLAGIAADAARRPARSRVVVFLGDYVSRGLNSRRVVDLVRHGIPPGFESVTLKGNHEDLLLRYLGGELGAGRHWFDFDGLDTLGHYGVKGVDAPDDATLEKMRARFREALPPAHLDFFRGLMPSHTEGGYRFVHAGVRPAVPLSLQSAHDQMWIRSAFTGSHADHGAVIVHGHCIAPEPQVRQNRIGIDTGAYRSGILTCLALEGASRSFLQTVPR